MTFTENQLKGNWGEFYIAQLLSEHKCLVRAVPQGHDSGIDLYCERVINGQPFLHFYVQVKTGSTYFKENFSEKITLNVEESNKTPDEKEKIRQNKYTERVKYWQNQPVPVWIFCINEKNNKNNFHPFYIFSTLDFKSERNSISNRDLVNSLDDFRKYFDKDFFYEYYKWTIMQGRVTPIPKIDNTKSFYFLSGTIQDNHKKKLSNNICFTLWRIIEDSLRIAIKLDDGLIQPNKTEKDKDRVFKQLKPYILALEKLMEDKSNLRPGFLIILGFYYEFNETYDLDIAKSYYVKGISLLTTNFLSKLDIDRLSNLYNNHLTRVQEKLKEQS